MVFTMFRPFIKWTSWCSPATNPSPPAGLSRPLLGPRMSSTRPRSRQGFAGISELVLSGPEIFLPKVWNLRMLEIGSVMIMVRHCKTNDDSDAGCGKTRSRSYRRRGRVDSCESGRNDRGFNGSTWFNWSLILVASGGSVWKWGCTFCRSCCLC